MSASIAAPRNDRRTSPMISAAHTRPIAPPLRPIDLLTATTPVERPSPSMTPAPFACVPERADPPRRLSIASATSGALQPVFARLAAPVLLAPAAASPRIGSPRAVPAALATGARSPLAANSRVATA